MAREVPRRGLLQGMGAIGIGIGGGMGSPAQIARALDDALADADEENHDPHTVATWQAVVEAVVPETENLVGKFGEELGDEHDPGGLAVNLEIGLIEFINGFISPEATVPRLKQTGETAPLSESITVLLDGAAAELLARGGNRDEPQAQTDGGGPFASLSRKDRFRALADIEERGGKFGGFVVAIVAAFPAILYYSEWSGYDEFSQLPSERKFEEKNVQSWTQTDYEGPVDGASVLLGYEVDEFEETYEDGDGGSTGGDGQPPGKSAAGAGNSKPETKAESRPTGHSGADSRPTGHTTDSPLPEGDSL